VNPAIVRAAAFVVAAVALVAAVCGLFAPPAAEPPNIVLVIGDDHGYPYSGFMGDALVQTPNLDRLAHGGVVFTTAYVTASVCEPSLRALLTGAEAERRGDLPGSYPLDPGKTLPGLLRRQGYRSFQVGKLWQPTYARAGFDEGTKGTELQGSRNERAMGGREGLAVGRSTMAPVHDFIDRHTGGPFFLWFAPMLPHRPWTAPDGVRARYASVAQQLTPSALAYYANISRLDDAVGELVAYLDAKGLRSRTLIVYLSDNGFRQEPSDEFSPDTVDHAKGSMAEMGFRTPIIFNWPGHVPAGIVRDDLVSALDLFPTLLAYAGVAPPEKIAGIDLRPAIEGGAPVPRTELVGEMAYARPIAVGQPRTPAKHAYFVRSAKWHYVDYPNEEQQQLFDLHADPRELHDVAAEEPALIEDFRARIERWKKGG
jgi:uncharacterized sulfatase